MRSKYSRRSAGVYSPAARETAGLSQSDVVDRLGNRESVRNPDASGSLRVRDRRDCRTNGERASGSAQASISTHAEVQPPLTDSPQAFAEGVARTPEKQDSSIKVYRDHGGGQAWIDHVETDRGRAQAPVHPEQSGRAGAGTPGREGVFRNEGDFWTIAYLEHSFRLRDMRGLHYIAHLLARLGERFHVRELCASLGGDALSSPSSDPSLCASRCRRRCMSRRKRPQRGDAERPAQVFG